MARLPVLKPKKVIRALQRADFYINRQSGSHVQLVHKTNPQRIVTVPSHNKDIPKGTMGNIIRQAGLTIDEFMRYL